MLYPRQKKLTHPKHKAIIFDLKSEEEYKMLLSHEWNDPEPEVEEKVEAIIEETVEPEITFTPYKPKVGRPKKR